MELSILSHPHAASAADLVRLFHKTERDRMASVSSSDALPVGEAFWNAELATVEFANTLFDASVPDSSTPAEVYEMTNAFFKAKGVSPRRWLLNPSAPARATQPLADYLLANGCVGRTLNLMRLQRAAATDARFDGLTIIPARAAYAQTRSLVERLAAERGDLQLAEAVMLQIDDPHTEMWIALQASRAVGMASVMAAGEIGRLDSVYVAAEYRRKGIAMILLQRILDNCARSLFKHVLLAVPLGNGAVALFEKAGFQRFAESIEYITPVR